MPTRTIKIPVAEILEGGTKPKFYADLRNSLDLARRAANKSVSLCIGTDADLMTGGKCPKLYTYPQVSSEFPGASFAAASICRKVESKYRQERNHVRLGRKSVCHYRSMPWPLMSNKSTSTLQLEVTSEYATAKIRLAGGWWTVRLASGSSHRTHIQGLRNALKVGDSQIWVDRRHKAILGICVEIPVASKRSSSGTLTVCTARDAALVATKERSSTPFTITGDEVLNWIAQRDRQYQRLRQDRKSGKSRQSLSGKLRRVGDKWRRRMDSWVHESTSKIVAHALRRGCSSVKWDATIKSFASLPFYDLAEKLKYKCEQAGLEFVDASQAVSEPDINKPHVYFKYSPSTGRVKIGRTGRSDGGRHGSETDSPEDLVILAVDNQPKNKLVQREKHHHSYFADHREKGEWFHGEPLIHWLREAGWFGNAGNLSQIAQVLPTHTVVSETGSSSPEFERASGNDPLECSKRQITGEDKCGSTATALAATQMSLGS